MTEKERPTASNKEEERSPLTRRQKDGAPIPGAVPLGSTSLSSRSTTTLRTLAQEPSPDTHLDRALTEREQQEKQRPTREQLQLWFPELTDKMIDTMCATRQRHERHTADPEKIGVRAV